MLGVSDLPRPVSLRGVRTSSRRVLKCHVPRYRLSCVVGGVLRPDRNNILRHHTDTSQTRAAVNLRCLFLAFRLQRSTCTRSRWVPLLDSHGHWGFCPRRLRSLRSGRLLGATARASSCTAGKPAGRLYVLKQTLPLLMGCADAGLPRWLGYASRKAGHFLTSRALPAGCLPCEAL